ncbi:MAG: ATP-binding cassette domain-containing protein, partial [Burkholderiales bacterium]|nr:ATP-binding cassette domain-containing protein [Burkholderiales bacterium]
MSDAVAPPAGGRSAAAPAGTPAAPPVLAVVDLHKRFGSDREVLAGLSLELRAGERVALLGESGVGKSTLLNLVAGLERPDSGEILVSGRPIHALPEDEAARLRAREIGFVFQAFHLLPHQRLWQNVAVPLLLNGIDAAEARPVAEAMLGRVGLGDRAASLPRELSGGEQQRVAGARARGDPPRPVHPPAPPRPPPPPPRGAARALIPHPGGAPRA